jgi:1,4-dihydroxy-2-naphthoate octaprenyltransferase
VSVDSRVAPSRASVWVQGARPRTLGAAVVPVLVGSAAVQDASASRTVAALVVGLGLQIGVNYVNDAQDAARGVDTPQRAGPVRLVASGLASPRAVAAAGFAALAVAGAAGLFLAEAVGWWLVGVGAASMLAAVLYAGGPRPYGSIGLGELAVFVFFGLVATCGTAYVSASRVPEEAWWAGCSIGLFAVAILVVNNLRDIPTDAAANKRTLAVRLGAEPTRALYKGVVAGGFAIPAAGVIVSALPAECLLVLGALPLAVRPIRAIGSASGPALVPVLVQTAALHASSGLLLGAGLWLA